MEITNKMVVEKVLGWERSKRWPHLWLLPPSQTSHNESQSITPDFLNDHNAAMMVVEKMREDGWKLSFSVGNKNHAVFHSEAESYGVSGKSVCECICAAALKAKGETP